LGVGFSPVKFIILTQGQFTIVSDKDFADLVKHKWCTLLGHNGRHRACRSAIVNGKRKTVLMHRIILNAKDGQQVDHRNGDTLDNRRSNLRLCTCQQNCCNRGKQANNTSGYKGVYLSAPNKARCWHAKVGSKQPGKIVYGGYFHTAKQAAKKYDQLAKKIHGKFAKLNFP
jgi:HNH endonuclease